MPDPTRDAVACSHCGGPATCFGNYEMTEWAYACDECCGHGNEDGTCVPLAEIPALANKLQGLLDKAREEEDAGYTAAEARGREQERARLAALSPWEVREMVRELMDLSTCDADGDEFSPETLNVESTLLAAFAAQRGRGEALRVAASALLADVRRRYPGEALRCPYMIALDDALLAAPTKGEG